MRFLLALLRKLRRAWPGAYDPSRYYMRGPGPASARRKTGGGGA
jgi:hypothetical protein